MASLLPATARAQAVQAVAAPRAAAKAQPAAAARLGGPISQKQWLRNALAQRRGIAQRRGAASRSSSARVVARGGGEALVIGSSGQTAARVIVQLLRAGFKVTAGARGCARDGRCSGSSHPPSAAPALLNCSPVSAVPPVCPSRRGH